MKSKGKCLYCSKILDQEALTDHLNEHLEIMTQEKPSLRTSVFHIKVMAFPYFLNLMVKEIVTFKELDLYLRKIWLECCGHMSSFNGRSGQSKTPMMHALMVGDILNYEYDFGDTTELTIEVSERFALAPLKKITLLSRNEPFEIKCQKCHILPATHICPIHYYEEGKGVFCPICAEIHEAECEDFCEDISLPVVNSPRMGVCGYEGGIIDVKRDIFIPLKN